MSHTYNPRPSNTKVRGAASRGRGTNAGQRRNPSPRRNPTKVPGVGRQGRSVEQSKMEDGEVNPGTDYGKAGDLKQRAEYCGAFTKITPNEKRRNQVARQAAEEERMYEEHKASKRIDYISLPPQTIGGGAVTEHEVRRKQSVEQRQNAVQQRTARATYREKQKAQEEAQLREKKAKARQQTERNKERAENRKEMWDEDRKKKNDEFLRRFENKPKVRSSASDHSSDTTTSTASHMSMPNSASHQRSGRPLDQLIEMFPDHDISQLSQALDHANGSADLAVSFLI
ncbi:uncharacterized protein LOC102809101 [Saccoglossus kowalevskii]|uniref:Epithelial-stromal interaction protein 1-like n=1 Tax=Saccoglossus kowalevskii TaxID=10224 RepID=A0ABM0MNY1_SACKO|nr:PREDICTED: epithelial-stromal interaction protein 1-like [Saccoglossus kowalevskii]